MISLLKKIAIDFCFLKFKKERKNAIPHQDKLFKSLVNRGKNTLFGRDNFFEKIKNYDDFKQLVKVNSYEDIKTYIQKIKQGEKDVLWEGQPVCFAKTSGTTSGVKYIPMTKESLKSQISSANKTMMYYIKETKKTDFLKGKIVFLSGSPRLYESDGLLAGRLSGLINNHLPEFYKKRRLPSYNTNCIEDWEAKLDKIVDETINQNISLISGIPAWFPMYFEKLLLKANKKKVAEVFPNLSIIVHGGVNFKPYKDIIENYIGKKLDYAEVYPASEGFIAFQDTRNEEGLLLNTNAGIFFEFAENKNTTKVNNEDRISLKDVKKGVNYNLILTTNAGLWAYSIGDTIKFVSIDPYRIVVTGRSSQFISAFGEHIIIEEAEYAISETSKKMNIVVREFTVAPLVFNDKNGESCHEWFIEFEDEVDDLDKIAEEINKNMCEKNIYYNDLIKGNILKTLKITQVKKDGFINYMKDIGKLEGQNKVPRLSNDRSIANCLSKYLK